MNKKKNSRTSRKSNGVVAVKSSVKSVDVSTEVLVSSRSVVHDFKLDFKTFVYFILLILGLILGANALVFFTKVSAADGFISWTGAIIGILMGVSSVVRVINFALLLIHGTLGGMLDTVKLLKEIKVAGAKLYAEIRDSFKK